MTKTATILQNIIYIFLINYCNCIKK